MLGFPGSQDTKDNFMLNNFNPCEMTLNANWLSVINVNIHSLIFIIIIMRKSDDI